MHGSMQVMDGTAYFAGVVSYMCKMFMDSNTGVNVITSFFFVTYEDAK
jgi:hypothetical protein